MTGYRLLLEQEIIEAWRTHRIAFVAILFVAIGIAVPVALRYGTEVLTVIAPPDPELGFDELGEGDVVRAFVELAARFGAIAAVLLAMGSVAGERERGTIGFVLAKPIGRAAFLWSKFVAVAMILGLAIGLGTLGAWVYTSLLFDMQARMPWLEMALLVWLYLLVPTAFAILASTLAPSSIAAATFAFGGLVALAVASTVPTLDHWLPNGLLEVARAVALKDDSGDLDGVRTVFITAGFVAIPLALAWLRFRRADLR